MIYSDLGMEFKSRWYYWYGRFCTRESWKMWELKNIKGYTYANGNGLLVWLGTLHFTSKWSLIHLDLRPDLSLSWLLLLSNSLSLDWSWCLDLWLNSALSFSRSRERRFFRLSPRSLSLLRRDDGERERDRPMICCFIYSRLNLPLFAPNSMNLVNVFCS